MPKLTHDNLSSFTHKELSYFSHSQLEMEFEKLKSLASGKSANTPLPDDILQKYQNTITKIYEASPSEFKSIDAASRAKTISQVFIALKNCIELLKSATGKEDVFSAIYSIVNEINNFFN